MQGKGLDREGSAGDSGGPRAGPQVVYGGITLRLSPLASGAPAPAPVASH